MTRAELARASELIEEAAEAAGDADATERLEGLADQLARLADAERGPDHGRLARIENAFEELSDSVSESAAAAIEEAHDEVTAYRSGVEGV